MKQTEQTLLRQLRITEADIAARMVLLRFDERDARLLRRRRPQVEKHVDELVERFYAQQTSIAEIALLIGDADTLARLKTAQRRYVLDLFGGVYDVEYVNNRLRIGLVHKRIGVEPRLYLAAVQSLKQLLIDLLREIIPDVAERRATVAALDRLLHFDVTLVFEIYIRGLVTEIEMAKGRSEIYARTLEATVRQRTRRIEELLRTDARTGLANVRDLNQFLVRVLRAAERRGEPVSVVFFDIDDFKLINDRFGHQRGDEVLRAVGDAVKAVSRAEDGCFRYGGDEFCIILPNCLEHLAQEIYVDRLCGQIRTLVPDLRLSVGVVQTGPGAYADPASLLRLVDARMYAAKRARKGQA